MNNTSPFSFLESIVTRFQPPAWVVDEGQQRLVLFINHVLMQEKQAQERLLKQKDRVVHVQWSMFAIDLIVTPAGLVDRAPLGSKPDLMLSIAPESPLGVIQSVMAGKTPPVQIEGDVQLAADIGWLAENLRWDAEEDLSGLIGDAPAHAMAQAGRRMAGGLKKFLSTNPLSATARHAASSFSAEGPATKPVAQGSTAFTPPVMPVPQASAPSAATSHETVPDFTKAMPGQASPLLPVHQEADNEAGTGIPPPKAAA